MKHIILGTAGHIDHGKTALIQALTGINTDRLKEEQERGITIDIGFAWYDLPGGERLGIIDVPGHEKFVRNMLAGAFGIDLLLMVIAADEGIMPQTREHLDICNLLGVRQGVVALTKSDMVDDEWLELVREDVDDYLAETFLCDAPVVLCSARTGDGLDELRAKLQDLAASIIERQSSGVFRLPVDRVFSIRGFGTVVTGTVLGGSVGLGDTLNTYPHHDAVKVRGIEVHEQKVDRAYAGQRTALNLQGLTTNSISRGDLIADAKELRSGYMLNVRLHCLRSSSRPIRDNQLVHFHHTTSETMARVRLLQSEALEPGMDALAQIRLQDQLCPFPADNFVIRGGSPLITIGGGHVIEVADRKVSPMREREIGFLSRLDTGSLTARIEVLVTRAATGGMSEDELVKRLLVSSSLIAEELLELEGRGIIRCLGFTPRTCFTCKALDHLVEVITQYLAGYHRRFPLRSGAPKEEPRARLRPEPSLRLFHHLVEWMAQNGSIAIDGSTIRLRDFKPELTAAQEKLVRQMEQDFLGYGLNPPLFKDYLERVRMLEADGQAFVRYLMDRGKLIRITNQLYFHGEVIGNLKAALLSFLAENDCIQVSDFKNQFHLSRKFAIPLLEYFDQSGVTARRGEYRVLRGA